MRVCVGIDLGSTTTKAVVMTPDGRILGRGITNSRNNYDVACAVARAEAFTTARFALLRRAVETEATPGDGAEALMALVERRFRRAQHESQLEALAEACQSAAPGAEERAALVEILDAMRRETAGLFGPSAPAAPRSDFFRDVAASQFHRLAESVSRGGRARFERLMGCFDKAIFRTENAPPDLAFEANIRAAVRSLATGGEPAEEGRSDERGRDAPNAPPAAARLTALLEEAAAAPLEEAATVGTGYGRVRLPFPKEQIRSEILCHGLGAHYSFPRTATVLDIGGQDTKAIQLDEQGLVTSFQMNDRCAAGCGRYLGYIADEMNMAVHELGPLALRSSRPTRIASTCTVFAGAELRERLSLGQRREDILAGLHRAIILRALSLLARSGGVRDEFTFTGGVARNPAALAALTRLVEETFGARTINTSPDSIYTGAVGAALFARGGAPETAPC